MRGLFVTATDTGVGKTVLSAALLAAMAAQARPARAHKPVVTGLEDEQEIAARGAWPPDHELLAAAAGMDARRGLTASLRSRRLAALAAELAGGRIDPAAAARRALTRQPGRASGSSSRGSGGC